MDCYKKKKPTSNNDNGTLEEVPSNNTSSNDTNNTSSNNTTKPEKESTNNNNTNNNTSTEEIVVGNKPTEETINNDTSIGGTIGGGSTSVGGGTTNNNPITGGNNLKPENPSISYYSVNFHRNDGTDAIYTTVSIASGSKVLAPKVPIREGYSFKGWYTDVEATNQYDFTSVVTKDLNLYAKWQKNSEEKVKPTFSDKEHEIVNIAELNDGEIPYSNADENGVPNFIDGTFSAKKVTNADNAIEALNDIHHIMQFSDVKQEFEEVYSEKVNLGEATNYYRLQQTYHDIPVYGYQMIVSTDSDGTIQTLSGHYYPNIDIDVTPTLSANDAKDIINDTNKIVSNELCIYVKEDENPFLVWRISSFIYDYFIDANTGEVIDTITSSRNISEMGSGKDLAGNVVSFPVKYSDNVYSLSDNLRNISVNDSQNHSITGDLISDSTSSGWLNHEHAISAYTNTIKTYDYYANILGRDSTDDHHKSIHLAVNFCVDDNVPWNNAVYFSDVLEGKTFIAFGNADNFARCLDLVAHEYTHAVSDEIIKGHKNNKSKEGFIYLNESGALDEAYSDIIGEFIQNGKLEKIGEDLNKYINLKDVPDESKCERNFANPEVRHQPSNFANHVAYCYKKGHHSDHNCDNGGVHRNSGIINHAAYLMDQNWPVTNHADELATLFYKSMYYLSPDSTFIDCRHAVLASAKSMNMSVSKCEVIANAFQEVGVYPKNDKDYWENMLHVIGSVKDAETNSPIIGAQIVAMDTQGAIDVQGSTILGNSRTGYSDVTGNYDMTVNQRKYSVYVFAKGYKPYFVGNVDLSSWTETNKYMETFYLTLENSNVFVQGEITNALTGEVIEGATVKFRKNAGNQDGAYVQTVDGLDVELITNSSGQYYTATLPAGNYTLEATKDGFITGYKDIISGNSDSCRNQNITLTPVSNDPENPDENPEDPKGTFDPNSHGAIVETGDCGNNGDNIKYTLYEDGMLYIYGSGAIGRGTFSRYTSYNGFTAVNYVYIDKGITSIGEFAFYNQKDLKNIKIPIEVTSIEGNVFEGCSSLTDIQLPSGIVNIGFAAFSRCSALVSLTLPDKVESIGEFAFNECSNLKSMEIPSKMVSIPNSMFKDCSSLESVILPTSITSIGEQAFYKCSNLLKIDLPSEVTSMGDRAFGYCSSLTSVEIPSGVTVLERYVFDECSGLMSVYLPSGLASIEYCAFRGCSNLTSIEIPVGATSIGNDVFYKCYNLTTIEIPASITSIGDHDVFYKCSNLTIYAPSGSYAQTFAQNNKIPFIAKNVA